MPVGTSVSVTLCSSSTFMIFTAFQRLVDSDDCPAPVSRLAFDSACELVCGRASLKQVWVRENASPVSVWFLRKWLMRIRSSRLSDRKKTGARGLWRFTKWNQQEERGVRGISHDVLSVPWRQEKVKWRLWKVMLGGQTFQKHNCHWHLSQGKQDNEPLKNIFEMCSDRKVTCLFGECVQHEYSNFSHTLEWKSCVLC